MTNQMVSHAAIDLLQSCRNRLPEPDLSCPVEATLAVLRGRWTALIIRELLNGPRSFSELAQALPTLSDKVLTDRLAQLTESGALRRQRTPGWPARVHYALTSRGQALLPVLQALWDWGMNSDTTETPPADGVDTGAPGETVAVS